jgi:hypothetical protein
MMRKRLEMEKRETQTLLVFLLAIGYMEVVQPLQQALLRATSGGQGGFIAS